MDSGIPTKLRDFIKYATKDDEAEVNSIDEDPPTPANYVPMDHPYASVVSQQGNIVHRKPQISKDYKLKMQLFLLKKYCHNIKKMHFHFLTVKFNPLI